MRRTELRDRLLNFGFTKAQANLYIAGLELGPALMFHLALRANTARATAYYIMDELIRRGFFEKIKKGRRNYYSAASPEKLLQMTKERERLIKTLLPYLVSIQKDTR